MKKAMRRLGHALVAGLLVACGPGKPPAAPANPEDSSPPVPVEGGATAAPATKGCIVVQAEFNGQPAEVEGVLERAADDKAGRFVLRLTHPRCVVGLEHARYVSEVFIASAGPDLRPLIGARLRIRGDAVGGTTDLAAPAIIVLATDLERVTE